MRIDLHWLSVLSAALFGVMVACTGTTLALVDDELGGASHADGGARKDGGGLQPAADDSAVVVAPTAKFPKSSGAPPTKSCGGTPDAEGFATLQVGAVKHRYRLPTSYFASAPVPTPLLVVLHGCGDTADNAANWIGAPWALRPGGIKHLILSIGGRDGACWGEDNATVLAAIDAFAQCTYVDRRRVVLGGYSSGGELAFRLMYAEGASFAGLLLEKSGLAQAYPNTKLETLTASPPWAFPVTWVAGTEDSVFPIAQARLEKGLLQRAGHPLQFLEVPDDHSGKSDPNWQKTLLPAMSSWVTPLPSQ